MSTNNTNNAPNSATPAFQIREVSAEQREKLVAGIVRRQIERNTQVGPFEVHHMRDGVPFMWVVLILKNLSEALAVVKTAPGRVYDERTRLWAVPTEWYLRKLHKLEGLPSGRRSGDLMTVASFVHVYHEHGCAAQRRVQAHQSHTNCDRGCDAYWKARGF